MTPNRLLFSNPQRGQMKLRHLRLGAVGHCQSSQTLEAPSCRFTTQDKGILGP